jgi:predicted DNA-binding ribbon-helix-helix protein
METTQRMVPLVGGGRCGIKLDQATWQAIEWLAKRQGKSWQQWCANIIESTQEGENTTAAVRANAMSGLLTATVFEDRADQHAAMEQHPIMRNSGTLNDRQFDEATRTATIQGWSDFGGFAIGFGHDEHGQDCVWVKNGLRNGLHFAFVVPSMGKGKK